MSSFHFPSLVWGESIAIYLFLLGISAGSTAMVLLLKNTPWVEKDLSKDPFVKVNAFLAPITVIVGLILLIFHLARPWTFWYLMFNYSTTSIMSVGVMLFQLYFALLGAWLLVIFNDVFKQKLPKGEKVFDFLGRAFFRIEGVIEKFLLLVALSLGAYTGFLLSALISYPMLNNPVLPILFLVSGLSSGIAGLIFFALWRGLISTENLSLHWLEKIEKVLLTTELFLLFAFFFGLYLGGGQKVVAVETALFHPFWGVVFWLGVVSLGIVLPLLMNVFGSEKQRHQKTFVLLMSAFTLIGVFALRFFILYAGQMTLA